MYQQTLHVVVDPLCGWTWGAMPLLRAAQEIGGLQIELHGGGLITGSSRRAITPQWRSFALDNDARIAALTGQPFSENYSETLLRDCSVVLDSTPSITALLVARALNGSMVDMLHELQHSWYVRGEDITRRTVLNGVAQRIGLDPLRFEHKYQALSNEAVSAHIQHARELLPQIQGQGFPSAALISNACIEPLSLSDFYGKPEQWRGMLLSRLNPSD